MFRKAREIFRAFLIYHALIVVNEMVFKNRIIVQ